MIVNVVSDDDSEAWQFSNILDFGAECKLTTLVIKITNIINFWDANHFLFVHNFFIELRQSHFIVDLNIEILGLVPRLEFQLHTIVSLIVFEWNGLQHNKLICHLGEPVSTRSNRAIDHSCLEHVVLELLASLHQQRSCQHLYSIK